jgi:5-methylcytosine-specific restriction protein A
MPKYNLDRKNFLYDTARWRRLARQQLRDHPLCVMCLAQGDIEPATIADHIIPHKKDLHLFWFGELQSLCIGHHNGTKQNLEKRGYVRDIGTDGWPIDPNHPVNKLSANKKLTAD